MPKVELSQGTIHYREEGTGPAALLIHGLMVDAPERLGELILEPAATPV